MPEQLAVDGGTIAYDVTGAGPLVVLAHGMGDSRSRTDSSCPPGRRRLPRGQRRPARLRRVERRWPSYTRTDIAGDLIALVRHLGGPAVLVGHSISGGAVTIAAATGARADHRHRRAGAVHP